MMAKATNTFLGFSWLILFADVAVINITFQVIFTYNIFFGVIYKATSTSSTRPSPLSSTTTPCSGSDIASVALPQSYTPVGFGKSSSDTGVVLTWVIVVVVYLGWGLSALLALPQFRTLQSLNVMSFRFGYELCKANES